MAKYPQGSYKAPAKKKVTSKTGGMDKYAKDNAYQTAVKGSYQKFGLPKESGAFKSGAEPMDYAKPKAKATKTVTKKEAPKTKKPSRTAAIGIKGVANLGALPTRVLPSDNISAVKKPAVKGVTDSRKVYSEKDAKIAAIMAKGKKKNGTMKASAQRKIAKTRNK